MGPTVALPISPDVLRVAAGGSSGSGSRASAESNFRELDDVFLQTQTRIWLGEVLQTRLNEHVKVSDLLADGELLFEVSKVIWKMLLTRRIELRHIKAYKHEPFASRKSSGRYMPYSNVDSFLKVCKIMGLTGIDLFSPSDVVEKRNTRKVCMCLRSLSKRARSKHLNIPDFDIVTYTVPMPTDMVGGIRRSIELSQRSCLSSDSPSSSNYLRATNRLRSSNSTSSRNYCSASEESDEAESRLTIVKSCCSSPGSHSPLQMNSDIENALDLEVNSYNSECNLFQLDIQKSQKFMNALDQFGLSWSNESVGSVCSRTDDQPDITSTLSSKYSEVCINREANMEITDGNLHGNYALGTREGLDKGNHISIPRREVDGKTAKENHTACQLAVSNEDFHGTCSCVDGEGGPCGICLYAVSHGFNQAMVDDETGGPRDIDYAQISSPSSINSVSSTVFNCGFDDLFHVEDHKINSCDSEPLYQDSLLIEKNMGEGNSLEMDDELPEDRRPTAEKVLFDTRIEDTNFSTSLLSPRNTNIVFPCNSDDYETPIDLNNVYNEVELPQMDSNSLRDVCSHSPLDFQKDPSASNETGASGASCESILPEGFHSHARKHIYNESLVVTQFQEKDVLSALNYESDSKNKEEPSGFLQTSWFDTKDSRYRDPYSMSGTVTKEDSDNVNITSPCSGLQQDKAPVISTGDKFTSHMLTVSNTVESMSDKHTSLTSEDVNKSCNHECGNQDVVLEPQAENLDGAKDDFLTPESKPQGIPLLKTILKGTAVLGGVFLLVQMRRNFKDRTEEPKIQSKERQPEKGEELSSHSSKNVRNVSGVYPAEKLKF